MTAKKAMKLLPLIVALAYLISIPAIVRAQEDTEQPDSSEQTTTTDEIYYPGTCFQQSEMIGFDVGGRLAKKTMSDAEVLYKYGIMRDGSIPDAFRVCYADGVIKSI